jgi:hypothetical protein
VCLIDSQGRYVMITKILQRRDIEVVYRDDERGCYKFRVAPLNTIITVHLKYVNSTFTEYFTSHLLKLPFDEGPYTPSRTFDRTPAAALSKAIDEIVLGIEVAMEAGHVPSEEWLVEKPLTFRRERK